jgi:Putative peptidoglycan binding domain
MQRGPMMNSPSGFRRFGNGNFNRNDRFGRFNDGRFVRNHRFNRFNRFNHFNHFNRFNHFHHFNDVFIGDFGFPWWWGWGWGYPYGYYGYGYGGYGDYGSGYSYGNSTGSRVAELQSRLASAGYYHGAIDGIMGPATRRAIRAYERDHGYAS